MKTTPQHTPTPWTFDNETDCRSRGYIREVNKRDFRTLKGIAVARVTSAGRTYEQTQATAAFIVRACNSHDALLAALKAMREDYEELARNHSGAWHDDEILFHQQFNAQARAAIALAEGGEI